MHPKFKEAINLHRNGELKKANIICDEILKVEPKNFDILHLKGIIAYQTKNYKVSAEEISKAIKIKHDNPETHNNYGLVLKKLNKLNEAIVSFKNAINIKPSYLDAFINLAHTLILIKNFDDALSYYEKIIDLNPRIAEVYNNRGNILVEQKKITKALDNYNKAIEIKPNFAEAYNNRAIVYKDLRKFELAVDSYNSAIKINPNLDFLLSSLIYAKLHLCDWSDYNKNLNILEKKIINNERASTPFSMLHLYDSPKLQQKVSNIFCKTKYKKTKLITNFNQNVKRNKKIRVGYYSSDFYNHATSYLIAGLLEDHDRRNFEIFGFSFISNKNDEMGKRIKLSLDEFYDVSSISDSEIIKLSKKLNIDIAVDLNGFTENNRFGIFVERCAPIQVSYLGFPGTIESECIDYIIADKTLIPNKNQKYYSSKIIYLPDTYQVNDAKKKISSKKFSKKELGLPVDSIVLCCFNKSYKINPEVFNSWMYLLKKIEGSVLWLMEDNLKSVKNIKKEAENRNIQSDRIIFAKRMDLPDHLARHKVADLFIDTFPYTAHTTCSDALWAGLPVVTRMGESFASRVAGSLLTSINLTELITYNKLQYENKIIDLSNDKTKLNEIKNKLNFNRLVSPLFNIKLFTQNLENAYKEIFNRNLKKLPIKDINI